ncbi:MAG: hypothetical protein AAFO96_25765 [Bacteroidota bacterium]
MEGDKTRKIAIIVWKWNELEDRILTAARLVDYEPSRFLDFKNQYVVSYDVVKRRSGGDQPFLTDHRVICVRTELGQEEAIIPFLQDLVSQYQAEAKSNICVFLHRNEGFNQRTVDLIFKNPNVDRCFLFSDGQDYIYYATQGIGLIDDDGDFFFHAPVQKRPKIEVANDEKLWVFHSYFQQTWNYYQNEYSAKLLELREDLLDYLMDRVDDLDSPMSINHFHEILMADTYLQLRVKSFVEHPKLSEKENGILRALEQQSKKSYSFDDLQAFAQQNKQTNQTYHAIKESLTQIYRPTSESELKKYAPRRLMNTLQNHFLNLTRMFSAEEHKLTSHEP